MATDTVKWFNATKGFGFIQPDAGGADVFVHISAVERAGMRDLNEGQKIAYEVVADRRINACVASRNSSLSSCRSGRWRRSCKPTRRCVAPRFSLL